AHDGITGRPGRRYHSPQLFGGPDPMAFVARKENQRVGSQRMLELVTRRESEDEQWHRKLGGALHVSQPHWVRKLEPGCAIGLSGHVDAVERLVVDVKLVIKRKLFFINPVKVFDHLGYGALVFRAHSLDADLADVVERPDTERLPRNSRPRCVINDQLVPFD